MKTLNRSLLGFISRDSISINRRREIIGLLRILKKNRAVLCDRSEQKSLMLIDIARLFLHSRKAKKRDEISHRRSENLSPPICSLIGSIMVGKLFKSRPQRPVA